MPRAALNAILPEGAPPEWVELIPSGPKVQGRDGRSWPMSSTTPILEAFAANRGPLPIDWEHASEHKAPKGEEAPAAGWIEELQDRAGAIWGRVSWTPRGAAALQAREYRFLSPVFQFAKGSKEILRLLSAGLTNQPNLVMTALNTADDSSKEATVNPEILRALNLAEDADASAALNAIQSLKSTTPDLEKFVPRADFDALATRATNAEAALQAANQTARDEAIALVVEDALKAGKITPATADYHKAQCRTEGGLERFKAFCTAAPEIAPNLLAPAPAPGKDTLNADQLAMCRMFGHDSETIAKALKEDAR